MDIINKLTFLYKKYFTDPNKYRIKHGAKFNLRMYEWLQYNPTYARRIIHKIRLKSMLLPSFYEILKYICQKKLSLFSRVVRSTIWLLPTIGVPFYFPHNVQIAYLKLKN